jgi:hypothetical protein
MHILLLCLDENQPLDAISLAALKSYVKAFFQLDLVDATVPRTTLSPPGIPALCERTALPCQTRPGRPCSRAERQIFVPELFPCLEKLKRVGKEYCPVEDAVAILCVTRSELFTNDEGLLPGAPVPQEDIVPLALSSAKRSIGVFSLANLEVEDETAGGIYRMYLRKLLKLAAHEIIKMLGMKGCQSNQCLAYLKPFHPDDTSLWLCPNCELKLLNHKAVCGYEDSSKASRHEMVQLGVKRYQELADVLSKLSSRLENFRIGHRHFSEFEKDVDWLRLLAEQLDTQSRVRHNFVDFEGKSRKKQRSLETLLTNAYANLGKRTLHRILSEPILKKTCLVDMAGAAPYRQDSGNLWDWTQVIINRKHAVGGKYVELGGSHKVQKSIGAFWDQGLNASKIKRTQEEVDDSSKTKTRGRRSTVSDIQS